MDGPITTATSREERERGARVAVLPVGSFEQHGDFLPLITDTLVAGVIARRLSTEYGLFLLPPVTLSCSHEHTGFAGTVSISAKTLIAVVTDVAESLHRSGIDRLAIVNGHGGNYVLSNIVQQANGFAVVAVGGAVGAGLGASVDGDAAGHAADGPGAIAHVDPPGRASGHRGYLLPAAGGWGSGEGWMAATA